MNTKAIKQAVILCGGLGTRLRPISLNAPKPMALVGGRPFLEYLLEQAKRNGIKQILLLTGYKGEMIKDYFLKHNITDLDIKYSNGPVEWETGRRVWEARNLIEEEFILMYSDNYANVDFSEITKQHNANNNDITLLIKGKQIGNVAIKKEDNQLIYTQNRARKYNYVELGYMIVRKAKLIKLIEENKSGSNNSLSTYIEKLSERGRVGGVELKDRYLSISDPKRLIETRKAMRPKKIVLIDRDGTINIKAKKGEYVTKWDEFKFIPSAIKGMRELSRSGFKFIVISNQAGIARGMMTLKGLNTIHEKMIRELKKYEIDILDIYVSPDHWEQESETRKPAPGLFFQAADRYKLRLDNCLYIGDDERDCMAAANGGCGMVYLSERCEPPILEKMPRPIYVKKSIDDAVGLIKAQYKRWGNRL